MGPSASSMNRSSLVEDLQDPDSDDEVSSYYHSRKRPGDRKLKEQVYSADWELFQILTKYVRYRDPSKVITHVEAYDLWKDGTGGYVKLLSGGVGYDYVNLELKSRRGRGYSFKVVIYGRNAD